MAGVLGNLTDRLFRSPGMFRGHVVDFLQLPNWPIFNVADVCINIAAGVVILQALRGISVNGTRGRDTDDPAPAS
jgi:signal peptidase II